LTVLHAAAERSAAADPVVSRDIRGGAALCRGVGERIWVRFAKSLTDRTFSDLSGHFRTSLQPALRHRFSKSARPSAVRAGRGEVGGKSKAIAGSWYAVGMPADSQIFLDHLTRVFGKEDAIHPADAEDGGPPVAVFVYKNTPEEGMITGVTFGLSLYPHPEWKFGRPEVIVSVESLELDWPLAAATFAASFRGKKTFSYGDVFTTDGPLASHTKMDGFLVFAQSILEEEVASVQLKDYKINFVQFYPIYRSELSAYDKLGLEDFWKHENFDMYDVTRKPVRA
jgi:hypothetical protein